MSPNARWRCFKIVAPPTPNREKEISGGLNNALERGETLTEAKQSFLNAGYNRKEIDAAVQKIPTTNSQISKQTTTPIINDPATQIKPNQKTQTLPIVKIPGQKRKLSKTFLIILILGAVLVLIAVALLGIFWDKLF